MIVKYSESTKQDKAEAALLEHATANLEEIIKGSRFAADLEAEWDHGEDDKGRPLYVLRLSDGMESVSASLTRRDLRDRRELRYRLFDLWDDFLRAKIDKSLENLTKGSNGA